MEKYNAKARLDQKPDRAPIKRHPHWRGSLWVDDALRRGIEI
jgi:hypothetical protein